MNNSFIDRVNAIVQQNQTTDPVYPDAGIGALENVANNVPRQTVIADQPHMLAYINPQEENLLQDYRNDAPVYIGPDGIPAYAWYDSIVNTASNIGSSIRDTASNVYDTVSTAATNVFGDQGYIETAADKIFDLDGDSTPDTTVYGAGPVEQVTSGPITYTDNDGREHSTQVAAAAANAVIAERSNPLTLSLTSTKTEAQLEAEARDAGEDYFAFMGNFYPVNNSLRENLANLITPFDGAKYIDGVLTNTTTGEDMTGGGTATGLFGENTVYGVSDDPTNNPEADTDMGRIEQQMLQDIPPSDLAYFGSFFGNNVIPYFGGAIAGKMLDQGIEGRRAIMDEQISALEAGATPLYDDAGNYTGFDRSTMTGNVSAILDEYGAEGLLPGGLPEDVATAENERFNTVFDVQSAANENDPTGMSTEDGFITTGSGYGALDGTEYYINGDGTVQEVIDGKINYDPSGGETVDSVYGINDEQIIEDDPVVKSIYNKYYKSGKGTFLPAWLRRFSSGVSIDELLTKIEVDGEIKYQTPEGEIIDAKYITGAIVGPDTTETE